MQNKAKQGITNETKPFTFDSNKLDDINKQDLYIENDRVGIRIEKR